MKFKVEVVVYPSKSYTCLPTNFQGLDTPLPPYIENFKTTIQTKHLMYFEHVIQVLLNTCFSGIPFGKCHEYVNIFTHTYI